MIALLPLLLALALQDAEAPENTEDVPIPEKVHADDPADDPPEVTIRVEPSGDRVEEYRQNGRLYMVKITPTRGAPYYLMDSDGNGRLNRDDRDPRISPVYWKIYEWD